jgi:uncharacterized protein YhfF
MDCGSSPGLRFRDEMAQSITGLDGTGALHFFGDEPELADEPLELVLSGQKTATCWFVMIS